MDIFLVERMLSIYQFVLTNVLENKSNHIASPTIPFSRNQAIRFILVSALWLLKHTIHSTRLTSRNHLSVKELGALRSYFMAYDSELSGEMSVTDLPLLFQVSAFNVLQFRYNLLFSRFP